MTSASGDLPVLCHNGLEEAGQTGPEEKMSIHLLVDFGSTYTKVTAVDLAQEIILGRAQAPTTVDTDITVGLDKALSELVSTSGIDLGRVDGTGLDDCD